MHSPDLAADTRWSRFRAAVRRKTSVRGVVSINLAGDPVRCALNLCSGRAGALVGDAVSTAALVGAHARVLLAHADAAERAAGL